MKKTLLLAGLLALGATFPALAADLPARGPVYTKAPAMLAAYNWTGLYLGVNAGGAWGSFSVPGGADSFNGFVYGAQLGYNWQAPASPLVFGLEADINGSTQRRTETIGAFVLNERLPFFGTVRGRIGYSWDRWMLYATGGLAYQSVKFDATTAGVTASTSDTKAGYALGGGLEWAMADRWTTKIEYLYLDTGNTSVTLAGTTFPARIRNNVVRIGANYHF
jgi:outer membrane immunogenic protein